jgi:polysaccharide export outer membrane protein
MDRRLFIVLAASGALAGCSSTPADCALPPPGDIENYKLGPGDLLRITTFRNPDLTGEFRLDGTGTLAMPLVGNIPAGGKTARELEDAIETALRDQGLLVHPQVSAEVLEYRDFYIIGEVEQPGGYPYVNGITVVNAVALAGGFTYRADQTGITLERHEQEYCVEPSTSILPGDVITVSERFF